MRTERLKGLLSRLSPSVLLDNIGRNFRWALRQVMRRPGFALLTVLTLAVGIGPNVAIFSVLKAMVLQPFYYPEPDRLVQVWETDIGGRWRQPFTSPDYYDVREQSGSFKEFGVYTTRIFNLSDGEAIRLQGAACTAGVLRAYGVPPARGRFFTDEEELEGNHRVILISDGLWKERFGAAPDVLGRQVRVNGLEHEIIGVMPPGFQFSSPWFRGNPFDLWTPIVLSRDNDERGRHWLLAIARLNPGVDWKAAESEIRGIADQLSKAHPATNVRTQMWIMPFAAAILGQHIGNLVILTITVGFVLLVACANVASLLLAKGAGRQTETAIRIALGAGRWRIVGQMMTESLLLAVLGGIAGVLLALWSLDLLRNLIPTNLPGQEQIGIDQAVLTYSFAISLLTALLFGIIPALTASRTQTVEGLKEGSGSRGATKVRNRISRVLAVVQIAIALLLTNGAVILYKSYRNILSIPQGFNSRQVLTSEIWLWGPEYEQDQQRAAFARRLIERIEALPGVLHAAITSKLPLEGGTNREILAEGEDYDPQIQRPLAETSFVHGDYFDAMGIRLQVGRKLNQEDASAAERVAVVNRALVDRYWPGENGIGRRIRSNSARPAWSARIVGVVENVRQWSAVHNALPEVYEPYGVNSSIRIKLIVHSQVDPLTLVPAIRRDVAIMDPDLPVSDFRTMGDVLSDVTRSIRFLTLLLDLFTLIAVILAVSGVYGFVSYQVSQKTHELGIRLALGATRSSLVAMVLKRTFRLVILGAATGIIMTFHAAFISRSLVYGISPLNPLYLGGSTILVILVSLLACSIPAIRGSRVDPMQALRTE